MRAMLKGAGNTAALATWEAAIGFVVQNLGAQTLGILRAKELKPVALTLSFWRSRPRTAPSYRLFPTVKPDIDKLVRAALDKMSGAVMIDDRQVVELHVYDNYGDEPGMRFQAWEVE